MRALGRLLKDAFVGWSADNAPRLAAALAFYALFSFTPLVLVGITIASAVYGQEMAEGRFQEGVQSFLGADTARAVQETLAVAAESEGKAGATAISTVLLLLGASAVLGQMAEALNAIFRLPVTRKKNLLDLIKAKAIAFVMVLAVGVLLFISIAISTFLAVVQEYAAISFSIWQALDIAIALALVTLSFALIYRFVPERRVAWKAAWAGALAAALLFLLGKYALSLYLARAQPASAYGAAGSLVVILLWVYYSAQIFLFGAEFAKVCGKRTGELLETEA